MISTSQNFVEGWDVIRKVFEWRSNIVWAGKKTLQ